MINKPAVTIIGAGLVGSLLSIYLVRRGYAVTVFERRRDMRSNFLGGGRSINMALSNRGLRALNEVGMSELVRKGSMPMRGRLMHDVSGKLSFLPYGTSGQFINSISRTELNMILISEAERLGVNFKFDHRCLEVDPVKTEVTFLAHKDTLHYRADVLVGADGAFSAVRTALQMTDRFQYSQHFIEHGYKELRIPPGENGLHLLDKDSLHIWPRESFMLIALPNQDATFTCTLFFPFEGDPSFEKLSSGEDVRTFFEKEFPDATALMPSLLEDFRDNPTGSLVTISCLPWVRNKTLLIGDAAHGIVPFFGQGMNAGFEDCRILNELLNQHDDNWDRVLPVFQTTRKEDTDAIAALALDNFVEMRDLVADPKFLLRKKIEARLHERYPDRWIPLYSMVTFNDGMRYSEALRISRKQNEIMEKVMTQKGIETKWSSLDLEEIVNQLTKE